MIFLFLCVQHVFSNGLTLLPFKFILTRALYIFSVSQHTVHNLLSAPLTVTWICLFRSIASCQFPEFSSFYFVYLLPRGGSPLPCFLILGQIVDMQNYTPPSNSQGFPISAPLTEFDSGSLELQCITIHSKSDFQPSCLLGLAVF